MNILVDRRLGMLKPSTVAAVSLTLMSLLVGCGGGPGSGNIKWRAIIPPKLTGLSPTSGPTTGGTTVAITGTDFQKGATVVFGGVPAAKINSVTSTSIEAVTPVHDPGNVDVTVTDPDTASDTLLGAFKFEEGAPTISSALPNSGPVGGGTVVTITGTDFQSGATVTFGQTPAAGVVFSSATQLLATTPAHAAGIVDVIVTNLDGQSATVPSGFTFGTVAIGCGTDCGNVGDPYEGGTLPAHTDVTACGTITPAAGEYMYLPGSIGTDPTATCLTLDFTANSGWALDLGGNAVTGAIIVNSNMGGATILNGVIACNIPDTTNCLKLIADNRITTQFRAHHLTINQQYTGASQARAIYVSAVPTTAYSGGGSGAGKRIRIDHISAVMSSSPDDVTTRRPVISVVAGATYGQSFQVDHNDITCPANAWSCWPVSFFNVGDLIVDHNRITMNSFDAHHAYGSGVAWEAGTYAGAHNAEIAFNAFVVNNHRAIRFWGCTGGFLGLSIHDSSFQQVNLGNRFGAIHLGEMGSLTNFQDAAVYSNTLDLVGGNGISVSGAQGVTILNNTATCSSGCPAGYYFGRTDVPDGSSSPADMTVSNNDVQVLTNAGLPAVMVCGPPGSPAYACSAGGAATSSATVSNSGIVVGNGTIR